MVSKNRVTEAARRSGRALGLAHAPGVRREPGKRQRPIHPWQGEGEEGGALGQPSVLLLGAVTAGVPTDDAVGTADTDQEKPPTKANRFDEQIALFSTGVFMDLCALNLKGPSSCCPQGKGRR